MARAPKNTKNDNLFVRDNTGYPIVPIQEDADVACGSFVFVTRFRKLKQLLGPFINTAHYRFSGSWVVLSDVVKYIFEPTLGFYCPD